MAINRAAIAPDVDAHPMYWLGALIAALLALPVNLYWVFWYRRRKRAELKEVKKILQEINE
jgi:hypothetical protein